MLIGVFNPSGVGRFHLVPGDSSSHPSIIKGETCQIREGKHSKPSHIRGNCKSRLILFNPPDNEYLLENGFVHFFGNLEFICSFMEHLKGCHNCVMSEKHEISKLLEFGRVERLLMQKNFED